ncbi:MAG: metallophosphoesterase family protein [Victivallales bacterium]|nr:metallophosphoesterase family protein [Victivallales bacterium]
MRILFFSDLHNETDALTRLPDADLVLMGGDFTTAGTHAQLSSMIQAVAHRFPAFLGVVGNMDPGTAGEALLNQSGHGLPATPTLCLDRFRMMGLGGGNPSPFHTPYEWSEEEQESRLTGLAGPLDILVTHAPPLGFGADMLPNGMHVGSQAIANLVARLRPALHLCGHIHEAAGIFNENGTILVNPGPFGAHGNHAVIEWRDGEARPAVWLAQAIK